MRKFKPNEVVKLSLDALNCSGRHPNDNGYQVAPADNLKRTHLPDFMLLSIDGQCIFEGNVVCTLGRFLNRAGLRDLSQYVIDQ